MATPSLPEMSARAWAELGLLALVWGGSFFSIAIALREVGPLTAVLHRVGGSRDVAPYRVGSCYAS